MTINDIPDTTPAWPKYRRRTGYGYNCLVYLIERKSWLLGRWKHIETYEDYEAANERLMELRLGMK